jgi:putative DNA primase/helicase
MSLLNIPEELKAHNNWVVWKTEIRKGNPTKLPYDANQNGKHVYAKVNNAATWASFDRAVEVSDVLSGNDYEGAGFVFTNTEYIGIDLDGVVHEGTGVHVILESSLPLPAGNRKGNKKLGGEIYNKASARYFTATGDKVDGLSADGIAKIDDPEKIALLHFMVMNLHDPKVTSLWMGDFSAYPSHSEADMALCSLLARRGGFRTVETLDAVFRQSGLMRPEWEHKSKYTIAKALSGKDFVESGNSPPTNTGDYTKIGEPTKPTQARARIGNTIKPKRVNWLWQDKIPLGKLTLFAGNPDNGKSLAAVSVTSICSTGRPFPNTFGSNTLPPGDVMMLLGEDDVEDTAVPRLMAAGADMSRIHFIDGVVRAGAGDDEIRLDMDMKVIECELQACPNIRLIVVDPISNYLGSVSMVAEQDVRRVLIPLKNLADQYNASILLVMHLNKKADLDAINRVGGAMAFIGVARCSWLFARDVSAVEDGDTPESFSMSRIKNNLVARSAGGLSYTIKTEQVQTDSGMVPVPVVVWGEVTHKTADDALEQRHQKPGRPTGTDSKAQEAVHFLESALRDGPRHRKDLEIEARESKGITAITLRRAAIDHLKIKPEGKGRDWTWSLPECNATKESIAEASASTLVEVGS